MTSAGLRAARKSLGLSQPALAKILGVHWLTVSRWERGAHPAPAYLELAIAHLKEIKEVDK